MKLMRVPLAAVLLGGVGCASVQPVSNPAQFFATTHPDVVVVTYSDNSQVPVSGARVSGDTLLGTWQGLGEPVVVPLSQVQRIEAVQRNRKRTTFLIGALTVVGVAGVYAITQAVVGGGKTCDASYQPPTVEPGRCVGEGPGEP